MNNPNNPCLFCNLKKSDLLDENELTYASLDSYPVSDQHCLIIPKRHVKDYFELTHQEIISSNQLINKIKKKLRLTIIQLKVLILEQIQERWQAKPLCIAIFI